MITPVILFHIDKAIALTLCSLPLKMLENETIAIFVTRRKECCFMDIYKKFENIKTMIFDVDGVFTDNGLLVTEKGDFLRIMSARDGLGVRIAREAGYRLAIITGGDSIAVKDRLLKLGISDIFLKIDKKIEIFEEYLEKEKLDPESILYMGDDLLDIEVMESVYLSCCPRDAAPEVLEVADYISPINGGAGCVRDVIEKVLQSQGKWKW